MRNSEIILPLPLLLPFKMLLLIMTTNTLFSQWNYSGSFQPLTMNRLSDNSQIKLPFRIAEVNVGYTKGDFDYKTSSAVEYRWGAKDADIDLREAYVIWYPNWGEVKVGKQIHAWGAVDGNNPTDNLNPYDFYYMFLPGTDRKIGTLSASVKYYWNEWQLEAVVIPEHEGNRFPFDEPDFPISQSTEYFDPRDFIKKVPSEIEFGFKINTTMGISDYGLSYFSGRDRSFSLGGYFDTGQPTIDFPVILPEFCYRKTTMIGADFVSFIGDFTIRGEGGYFQTENDYTYDFKNKLDASYLQYAIQIEYITESDYIFTGQLIGSEIFSLEGLIYEYSGGMSFPSREINEDDFQQGMGTPFAMFTDMGMFISASGNYLDNALEIRVNTFIDMEDDQSMLGGGFTYSPIENWEIGFSATKFIGAMGTQFKKLEDFSHIQLGLKYSF